MSTARVGQFPFREIKLTSRYGKYYIVGVVMTKLFITIVVYVNKYVTTLCKGPKLIMSM